MTARKSFAWSLGANLYQFIAQFAGSIVLARLLSPAEMGVYAIALSTLWILNAFQNLGLPGYIVREPDMSPRRLGTVYTMSALQSLLLAGVLWILAPFIADFVRDSRVIEAQRILCLYVLLLPVQSVRSGLLQRRMRFDLMMVVGVANATVATVVTVAGAFAGLSYTSMSWGAVAGAVAGALATVWVLKSEARATPSLAHWREVWAYGRRILMSVSVQNICLRLPDLILGRLAGIATTGLYNRGASLIDVFNASVASSFVRVIARLLVEHRDALGSIRHAYLRTVRIMTGLFWPAFAGLAVLAAPVITLLYGVKWVTAAPVMSLLAMAMIIAHALPCRAEVLITMNSIDRMPRLETIRGVGGISMFAAGAGFGMTAAAATRIAEAVLGVILYLPQIHELAEVGWSDLARAYVRSAIVAVAAAAPAAALMMARGWPDSLPTLELFGAIAAGIACWLGAIFVVRHELRGEIERAARNFFVTWGLRR